MELVVALDGVFCCSQVVWAGWLSLVAASWSLMPTLMGLFVWPWWTSSAEPWQAIFPAGNLVDHVSCFIWRRFVDAVSENVNWTKLRWMKMRHPQYTIFIENWCMGLFLGQMGLFHVWSYSWRLLAQTASSSARLSVEQTLYIYLSS